MSYEYDDFEDFFSADSDPNGDGDYDPSYDDDSFDDSMDGDAESAFGSCGWGVDEYYNPDCGYGDDW
jgi:hypothetical protein